MVTASDKQDRAVIAQAYVMLLALRHGVSRARLQPVLAGLRDEIALLDGLTPEEIQNKYELIARS